MIAIPNNRGYRARAARSRWNPIRGRWDGLGSLDPSWCDTASAWNPLSYVFCLPSDIRRVTAAATATFPAPPAAAPPGAPQTVDQMTLPGAYTPLDSAIDSHDASLQNWTGFFQTVASDNSAAAGGNSSGIPAWVWLLGAGVVGVWAIGHIGVSRR